MLLQHAALQKASLMEEKHLCYVGEVNQLSKTLSQNLCKNETELHGNGNFLFLFISVLTLTVLFFTHSNSRKCCMLGFRIQLQKPI